MHSSKLPAQDHGPAASSCAKPGAEGGCGGLCKPPSTRRTHMRLPHGAPQNSPEDSQLPPTAAEKLWP